MKKCRVLLVDDHPMWRFGMIALLEMEPDMQVVGEAGDGEEGVRLAVELQPDLVLMDIVMPGIDGVEATRQIVRACPNTAILIMTMLDDDSVFDAMRAGARGYQCKVALRADILRAVRAVVEGEAIFSPGAARRLLNHFNTGQSEEPERFPSLTPRERQILDLLALGLTNQEIAEQVALSAKTIRNRVSIIFSKLQVNSRAEAIIRARKVGIGV